MHGITCFTRFDKAYECICKSTFLSNFKGEHPCRLRYSLCFLRASSSKSSSSSEEDDLDDFELRLDFGNDDFVDGLDASLEEEALKPESSWGMELNLLSNPDPKPLKSESSEISLYSVCVSVTTFPYNRVDFKNQASMKLLKILNRFVNIIHE